MDFIDKNIFALLYPTPNLCTNYRFDRVKAALLVLRV